MFLNLKDFAGTSPHTPSLTCDAAGAGGTAQKARLTTCPCGRVYSFGGAARGIQKDL